VGINRSRTGTYRSDKKPGIKWGLKPRNIGDFRKRVLKRLSHEINKKC
jgi:hypothetical protein